ncbi:hypothetical protein V865_000271 [Kwoniella europaea PYCC6329]|uniref:Sensitive to high expression protein 9, mitochondrial n=1 Tax=Kwoniella europaea PYCC6329 TaxID=1423913 RepID=A0AAX4K8N9_9TREE
MAYRHVLPVIATAIAGPGPSTITRYLNSSVRRPLLASTPLCPVHPCRRIAVSHRWSSTQSPLPISEKNKNLDDSPHSSVSTNEKLAGEGKGTGLPIPGGVATGSTSFSGTGSIAGQNSLSGSSTISELSELSDISRRNEHEASETTSPSPNYPTLPSSSSTSKSSNASLESTSPSSSTSQSLRLPSSISLPPEVRERLTEWSTTVLQHSKRIAKDAQKGLMDLGLRMNEMTGYKEVERLKGLVFEKEDSLQKLRESARSAKLAYDEAVSTRSNAQRDVNTLLERKHSWDDSDVLRFTHLVRQDHSSSHAVVRTSSEMKEAEMKVDKAFNELMQTILQRYHEEQVWSDKIRSVSTYANLLGLALNAIIFLGAIIIVEPWKRKRLVNKLEERMSDMMLKVESGLKGLESKLHEATVRGNVTVGDFEMVRPITDEIVPTTQSDTPTSIQTVEERAIEDDPMPIDLPPEIAIPPLDPLIPSISTSTVPMFEPMIQTRIEGLPPYLNVITQPSQERDMAIAGMAGAAMMGLVITLGKWIFS